LQVLTNVIREAKRNNYNNQILWSNNKIKTTWDIVKLESGKRINKNNNVNIQEINLDDSINNPQDIAKVFNEYFLSVAQKISSQVDKNIKYNNNDKFNITIDNALLS
jgi:hypothetical protein